MQHRYSIPNILTYGRIIAVPLLISSFFIKGYFQSNSLSRWIALSIFTIASITDFLDGYLARSWGQTSRVGRILDPIADKILVASCLLLLAANHTINGWNLWAALIILCREVLVSGLREHLAEVQISLPVSCFAKYKTTFQMFAIGFLLIGPAGDHFLNFEKLLENQSVCILLGVCLLWISAILTLMTGWNYFKEGLQHVKDF